MLTQTDVTESVIAQLRKVLADTLDEDEAITVSRPLRDLGLNSLMLARVIVGLEQEKQLDPFSDGTHALVDVRSVGDLVEAYQDAASTAEGAAIGSSA